MAIIFYVQRCNLAGVMDRAVAIPFVKASSRDIYTTQKERIKRRPIGTLSGHDAKIFYENITSSTEHLSEKSASTKSSSKAATSSNSREEVAGKEVRGQLRHETTSALVDIHSERNKAKFFKAAQDGNCKTLETMVKNGFDVNVSDFYGWTALMMAVCASKEDAVKILLDLKTDRSLRTKTGETVYDLAIKSGTKKMQNIICTYGFKDERYSGSVAEGNEEFGYNCEVCKVYIDHESPSSHETSVVHMLNAKRPVNYPNYSIPESNRGFQMMLRSGWNKEKGLGPEGQGKQFPIKTILKRDRTGLGVPKKEKLRVTHFQPKDTKAVEHVLRKESSGTLKRRALSDKTMAEKEKEKLFRREFY